MLIYNFCLSTRTQLVWEGQSSKIYKQPEKWPVYRHLPFCHIIINSVDNTPYQLPPLTSVKQGTFGKGLKGRDQFWASPPLPQLGACHTLWIVSVGAKPSCPPGEEDARARTAPAGVGHYGRHLLAPATALPVCSPER